MRSENILEVRDLSVGFPVRRGLLRAANRVSLTLPRGKTVGIVGESGCGKSVVSQAIMRLLPPYAQVTGSVRLMSGDSAYDVLGYPENSRELMTIRGAKIGMIFQEPMSALFPMRKVGAQMAEAIRLHVTKDRREARRIGIDMLGRVGIKEPDKRFDEYPHQFSGGMCQRILIAMALSLNPEILIADEPTTALDVTVQAQVLELIRAIQRQNNMSILFISHDIGVIVEMADVVLVMYAGQLVERAPVRELFHNPLHPYTRALIQSIIPMDGARRKRLFTIEGTVPVPVGMDDQCGFYSRCPQAIPGLCDRRMPPPFATGEHEVRCFLHGGREEGTNG